MKLKELLSSFEYYDLSFPLIHDAVSWPTHQPISVKKVRRIDRDLYEMHEICMTSQDYTHFDAPSHMILNGKSIDKYEPSRFILDSVILDISDKNGKPIRKTDLEEFIDYLGKFSGVILYTGFDKEPNQYRYDWGYLDLDGANYIAQFDNIKLIGIDSPSIAGWSGDVAYSSHRVSVNDAVNVHLILLKKDILILEGIYNISIIFKKYHKKVIEGILVALPLNLIGIDGGLARVIFLKPKDYGGEI